MITPSKPKYYISGDDITEVPGDFVYFHKDSIQAQTLWLADRPRNENGVTVIGYHVTERYLRATHSGGSLPDSYFTHIGRFVTIS